MNDCDVDLLSQYLDRDLTLPQRVRVEDHLRICGACAVELEEMANLDRALAAWGATRRPIPMHAERRIARSVDRPRRRSGLVAMSRMMPAAVGTTAAALLVLATVNLGTFHPNNVGSHDGGQPAGVPHVIARQSAGLIKLRRSSAVLGSYITPQAKVVPPTLRRVQLDYN